MLMMTMAVGGHLTFMPGLALMVPHLMGDMHIPGCTFCHDMGHMVRFCPVTEEYIQ